VLVDAGELARAIESSERPAAAGADHRRAAVFVLLTQRRQTELLLIKRADRGDPWSNDIAFPGGHVNGDDGGALTAAYRETHEEVGIDSQAIDYLADLGHFPGRQLKVDVHAFVGLWNERGPLQVDTTEVADVFQAPLGELLRQHETRGYKASDAERLGDTLVYTWDGKTIWGITARIIHRLLCLLGPPGRACTDARL
jgi:8-oxo-dGTP pyrophosphatase MutT (NUDIX family)